ncbi:MAG: ATP-binding protein [Spirochaetia bacterium]
MLIEFSIGNFKSYKDISTISLLASSDSTHLTTNVVDYPLQSAQKDRRMNILKSAVLYGANASGKSNLFDALKFVKYFVFNSSKNMQVSETIPTETCKVSTSSESEPSHFELIFTHEKILYRYGFDVNSEKVVNEWLFFSPKGKEAKLFIREGQNFQLGEYFKEGKGLDEKTRENALFLSVCAQFNGEISTKVLKWFSSFNVISGIEDKSYLKFTLDQLGNEIFLNELKNFLQIADVGIEDINFEQRSVDIDEIPDEIKDLFLKNKLMGKNKVDSIKEDIKVKAIENKFRFMHRQFDRKGQPGQVVPFTLEEESQGTQKLFALSGPLIDTLKYGKTLFIDELDTRLHPLITQFILRLFHSEEKNPNNAQLICATHDVQFLSNRIFRRDQIWFTEKNKYNVTDLYSLSDYSVRKDATFNKDYILGKYGAVPYVSDRSVLYGTKNESEEEE